MKNHLKRIWNGKKISSKTKLQIEADHFRRISNAFTLTQNFLRNIIIGFEAGNVHAYLQYLSDKLASKFLFSATFHVFYYIFLSSLWYRGAAEKKEGARRTMAVARSAFIKTVPDLDKFMHQLALLGGRIWINKYMKLVRQ